jgi:hypothetical protein
MNRDAAAVPPEGQGDPYYPQEQPAQPPPDYFNMAKPEQAFLNEQLVRNTMLWETDLKQFGVDHLTEQKNSVGFINTWKKLTVGTFDRTKILGILDAKTFSYEEAVLRFRLRVNLGKTHYETFDLDTPQSLTVPIDMENDFRFYLTRAVGGKEREYQSKIMFGNENTNTSIIKDMRAPGNGGKKRFFGLF